MLRIVALLAKPGTVALLKKLGTAWVVAFAATSGSIWARRVHKDDQPQKPWRRRP